MSTAMGRPRRVFSLSLGLALFLGLALVACPAPPDEVPEVRPEVAEDTALVRAQGEATDACVEPEVRDPCVIVIAVDQEGNFTYREQESGEDAQVVRLRPEQRVQWQLEGPGGWGVEFARGRSPLPAARYGSRRGLERGARIQVQEGLYKYFVAVIRQGQLYTDDPEFII